MDIVPLLARLSRDLSKLSYFHVPGKEPLLPWTVGDVIDRAADSIGDTTAIVSNQHNISKTYARYRKDREIICLNSDLIYGFGRTMGVLAATMFGSTIVMPGTEFVPKQILEAIKKYR
ncbi:hypothetical protein HPB47_003831 [Ixodes persulcatus]|uniref:Uncharacterized protein n=1 Tax=Ixodes persulcatus TaxID=34615 RepID=A0AC60PIS3_IXOPE|nr:hypothetical protein HPB47_003831 [Ixodes persulcatus]